MDAHNSRTTFQLAFLLSPHLALYRLRCLFPKLSFEQRDCFKSIWRFYLMHNLEERAVLQLSEHRTYVTIKVRIEVG